MFEIIEKDEEVGTIIKVFGVGFMYGFLYHTAEEKLNFRNQIRVCGFCVIHMRKLLG